MVSLILLEVLFSPLFLQGTIGGGCGSSCYILTFLHVALLNVTVLHVTCCTVRCCIVTLLLVTLLLVTLLPVLLLQYYMSHPILIRGPQERRHRHQKQVSSMFRTKVTISLLEVVLGLLQPLHHFLDLQVDLRLMKMVPNDFPWPKTLGLTPKTSL